MKTVLPSYVPPPYALRLGAALTFGAALRAAMLRGAGCGRRALRESFGRPRCREFQIARAAKALGVRAAPDRRRADRYTVRVPHSRHRARGFGGDCGH